MVNHHNDIWEADVILVWLLYAIGKPQTCTSTMMGLASLLLLQSSTAGFRMENKGFVHVPITQWLQSPSMGDPYQ